jgi:hypothetical protein
MLHYIFERKKSDRFVEKIYFGSNLEKECAILKFKPKQYMISAKCQHSKENVKKMVSQGRLD